MRDLYSVFEMFIIDNIDLRRYFDPKYNLALITVFIYNVNSICYVIPSLNI
jgi:hypothetical protein